MNGLVFFTSLFLSPVLVIISISVFIYHGSLLGFVFLAILVAYYYWVFKEKLNKAESVKTSREKPEKNTNLKTHRQTLVYYGVILITAITIVVAISDYISIRSITNDIGNLKKIRGKVKEFHCSDIGIEYRVGSNTASIKLYEKEFNQSYITTNSLLGEGRPCGYISKLLSLNNEVWMLVDGRKIIELRIGDKVIFNYEKWKEQKTEGLYKLIALSCFLLLGSIATKCSGKDSRILKGMDNT